MLNDPVRAALYAVVRDADAPVSRAEAAAAVGISTKLAAFHLDRMVDAGLLQTRVGSPAPRRVGRAPKLYVLSADAVSLSIPPREPQLLAEVLVAAIEQGTDMAPVREAVLSVARQRGEATGEAELARLRPGRLGAERALAILAGLLARHGFEPRTADSTVRLRNCPFHPLAQQAPALVCGLNHAFVSGIVDGLRAGECVEARLAPAEGQCCVELRRA